MTSTTMALVVQEGECRTECEAAPDATARCEMRSIMAGNWSKQRWPCVETRLLETSRCSYDGTP